MPKVTQQHIAKHAGVSRPTVSLVLSGRSDVAITSETRERVLRAAHTLGYQYLRQPDVDAPSTGKIGFFRHTDFPTECLACQIREYEDHYLSGVVSALSVTGHHLLLVPYSSAEPLPFLFTSPKLVDGVIIKERQPQDTLRLALDSFPAVLMDYPDPVHGVDGAFGDDAYGIRLAMEHLYALGHRRIALFGLASASPISYEHPRFAAYRTTRSELRLPASSDLEFVPVVTHPGSLEEVHATAASALAAWSALPSPPTAVVTVMDLYALAIIQAAQQRGLAVPAQLSVTGFDNLVAGRMHNPGITTVDRNLEAMGRTAGELLLRRLEEPGRPFAHVRVQPTLVVRGSTGHAPTS